MRPSRHAQGFTLIEVMVAITIMALIAALAGQALHTATVSGEATNDAVKRMSSVDRAWLLLDADLRNALPRAIKPPANDEIPALTVGDSRDYWLTVLRGGVANPLHLARSEVVRVGYRIQEGVLWRDTWEDTTSTDQRKAIQQKIMTDVKDIVVRVLAESATSIAAGPWLVAWPAEGAGKDKLPKALEITIQTENLGELKRLFAILPGEDVQFVNVMVPGANNPSGNNAGGKNANGQNTNGQNNANGNNNFNGNSNQLDPSDNGDPNGQ